MSLVPQQGYTLHALPLTGLAGSPLDQARAGLLSLRAVIRCTRIIQRLRPLSVLGVGGYASAPAVIAARTLGVPTFLHEQNSVPGRVNAVWVGMPTRTKIFEASQDEALRYLGLQPPVALIFGGSGGALRLNLAAAEAFGHTTPYSVVQISGRRDFSRLSTDNPRHTILEFTGEIWWYLAAADVVVSRAGAGSLFDIAAAGRAAILVPFPYATGDHQLENARYFTERGAAELMLDSEVGARALRDRVEDLLGDDARREELARRMRTLATPGAAGEVARRLLGAPEKE
jgi:UDP-N-acetylglucosamine--N-acetylmuramyl-(pentapeptide) pyrophosphoryl-undecaprenol N-acetylglucosamine transferase